MGCLKCNVYLIGFMGVGKTTVGRRLARELGVAAIDVDAYMHRRFGKDAMGLFRQRGERGLRRAEAKALAECSTMGPAIISCGEGIVVLAENRALMRDNGYVVWLESSAEASMGRIRSMRTRPLLARGCDVGDLWKQRRPLYRKASHVKVDVEGKSTPHAVEDIVAALKQAGVYEDDENKGAS